MRSLVSYPHTARTERHRWPVLLPGLVLGGLGAATALLSVSYPLYVGAAKEGFLVLIASIGLVMAVRTRHPESWVVCLFIVLALFPASEIVQFRREVAGGFNLFARSFAGIVSRWDLLLMILFFLPRRRRTGSGAEGAGRVVARNGPLYGLTFIWACGALNGLIHVWPLPYGPTSFRSVVQQTLPAFYVVASYAVVRRTLRCPEARLKIEWALRVCTAAVLTQGIVLMDLALRGKFPAMGGFLKVPIVIYDQMSFLNLTVLVTVAMVATNRTIRVLDGLMFAGSALFILASTRRMPLMFLLLNVPLVFALAVRRQEAARGLLRLAGAGLVVAGVLVAGNIWVPNLAEALVAVVKSLAVTSDSGRAAAGDFRLAELDNLMQNLGAGGAFRWAFGRGLGTYWHEYVSLNLPAEGGTTAFVEALSRDGARGWWPGFHLSYVSLIYRFGIVGLMGIFACVAWWVRSWLPLVRRLPARERALGVCIIVLTAEFLAATGESLDSAGAALFGLLIASLESLVVRYGNEMDGGDRWRHASPRPGDVGRRSTGIVRRLESDVGLDDALRARAVGRLHSA